MSWPTFWPKKSTPCLPKKPGKIARNFKSTKKNGQIFWAICEVPVLGTGSLSGSKKHVPTTIGYLLGQKKLAIMGLVFSGKFRRWRDLDPKLGPRGSEPPKTRGSELKRGQINTGFVFPMPENPPYKAF